MVPGDQHIRLPSAEELDHLLEAGPNLTGVAGSPLVFEDAHHIPLHAIGVAAAVGYLGRDGLGFLVVF